MPRTPTEAPDRACAHCGGSMEGKQAIARHCSTKCQKRAYYENNCAKVLADCRARYEANREAILSKGRARRLEKREPKALVCACCGGSMEGKRSNATVCSRRCIDRLTWVRNAERKNAQRRTHRARDPEKFRTQKRAWCAANLEKVRAMKRAHYRANREKVLARQMDAHRRAATARNIARNIVATLKLMSRIRSKEGS